VVYAGSIDRVDFGEQLEEKGWVYIELPEKGKADWAFRKVKARPFLTIEAVVESDNATEDVVRAIARCADQLDNAIVKLRIDVPPERVGELRDDDIRTQLKGAYYVTPFERTSRQRPRSRWGNAGPTIQRAGPIEALTLYLEHQKVDKDRRETLVRYAQTLMGEEPEAINSVLSSQSSAFTPTSEQVSVRSHGFPPVVRGEADRLEDVDSAEAPAEGAPAFG
jgi:exonuclease SbcD